MKFFDRKKEIQELTEINNRSFDIAQFTVITGRRRIGKTSLVLKAYGQENIIYLFVTRKAEKDLCESFMTEIEEKLGMKFPGKPSGFTEIFQFLMSMAATRHLILFIDEFQEFMQVNPSVYGDIQRVWDLNKDSAKINLIVGGSVNSLMNKIFRDAKEPLFQRQTASIKLRPFEPSVIKEILTYYYPSYTPDDLLALYLLTGGVAKYIEQLVDSKNFTRKQMLNYVIRDNSLFIDEGRGLLVGEFGKEYGNTFSILSAIAQGKNTRAKIEEAVGREVGGYLTRLENDYELIEKKQPIFEKSSNKNVRYSIADNFLKFWFRFIFKYNYIIEIGSYQQLRTIVERDYDVFSGFVLERYFRAKMQETQQFTRIGSWWNRKGENEIDIIAINEIEQIAIFAEVKRNPDKISIPILEHKSNEFIAQTKQLAGYTIQYLPLSLDDM